MEGSRGSTEGGRSSTADATEDDHLALLGLLNSSTACFWLKQVCHNKGSAVDQAGARQRTAPFEDFFAFNATKLRQFPIPAGRPLALAREMDRLALELAQWQPAAALRGFLASRDRQGAVRDHAPNDDRSLTVAARDSAPSSHDRQGVESVDTPTAPSRSRLDDALGIARSQWLAIQERMIAVQEDLDWLVCRLYGLIDEEVVSHVICDAPDRTMKLGERAFEIVLARKAAAGEVQTTWFERHNITPRTQPPTERENRHCAAAIRRRIEIIESNPQIALIEQPEYKRRWNVEPWESQQERALREWLLDRLESYFDFDGRMADESEHIEPRPSGSGAGTIEPRPSGSGAMHADGEEPLPDGRGSTRPRRGSMAIALTSISRLADVARQDADFLQVGEVYRDDAAFDVQKLVAELVESESVPLLPVLRYKATGLRKRAEWERTWELQRQEDAIDARTQLPPADPQHLTAADAADMKQRQVGTIPVPPKYTSADFLKSDYWRLRGKLDVPKERWVSFPHCQGPDGTLVIAWAGYNHLQLARVLSEYYVEVQERHGGRDDPRLVPLLAGLIELLPWLKQWHNAPDPAFDNMRMGDYFESFVNEEARQLGKTIPEIKAWEPPARTGRRRRG